MYSCTFLYTCYLVAHNFLIREHTSTTSDKIKNKNENGTFLLSTLQSAMSSSSSSSLFNHESTPCGLFIVR